jgi:tetratricopeptide (TPR) repeat protein
MVQLYSISSSTFAPIRSTHSSLMTQREKGNLALQNHDFQTAINCYTEGIKNHEENAHMLYTNRSIVYSSLKNHAKALEDALAAVEIDYTWVKVSQYQFINIS